MASTGITWSNITVDNGAIRDLREIIMLEVLKAGDFGAFHDVMTNVQNGDKLAGVGAFAEVGLAGGTTCAPTFNSSQARSVEKTWALGEWEVPEKICYKDLDQTAARLGLNSGTEIADISNTIIAELVTPLIEDALARMFWRLAWFGDTAAALISGGGKITAGKNVNLFTTCDGYWKALATIYGTTPARKTTIAANAYGTYATQFSNFTNAIEVLDALIYSAKIELRNAKDKFILCTRSVADAYEKQLAGAGTISTEIQWQTGWNGLPFFKRKGVDIYPIDLWDSFIQEYEDNGTKFNSPHRAVFTTKTNLKAGTPSNELIQVLDAWFSKDDQDFKMLARDKFGVLIMDDTLVQVAI